MSNEIKKILIFFPGRFARGGMERYLLNFQNALNKTRFQLDYLVAAGTGLYYEDIVKTGAKIYPLLTANSLSNFKVLKKLRHRGYNVVHFHADEMAVKAMVAAKLAGFKVLIAHSHNNSSFSNGPKLIQILKRFIVSNICNYRLAVSYDAGKWLFGDKPFEIMEPCLPMENYFFSRENRDAIRKKYRIGREDLVIGCVGHLMESHKNQSFLFDILIEIQKKISKSWLILVGGGFDEEKVKLLALESGAKNIIFVGDVDATPYYSAFDVFSLPSKHEGLGIAAVEAICNGLICVNSINVPLAEGLELYERRLSLQANKRDWANALICAASKRVFCCPKEYFEGPYYPTNAVQKLESFYEMVFKNLERHKAYSEKNHD